MVDRLHLDQQMVFVELSVQRRCVAHAPLVPDEPWPCMHLGPSTWMASNPRLFVRHGEPLCYVLGARRGGMLTAASKCSHGLPSALPRRDGTLRLHATPIPWSAVDWGLVGGSYARPASLEPEPHVTAPRVDSQAAGYRGPRGAAPAAESVEILLATSTSRSPATPPRASGCVNDMLAAVTDHHGNVIHQQLTPQPVPSAANVADPHSRPVRHGATEPGPITRQEQSMARVHAGLGPAPRRMRGPGDAPTEARFTGGLRLSPQHPGESATSLTNEMRCGDAEGSLCDRGCEGRDLGAARGGVSEAEIGRRLGLPKRRVSKYLQRMGGIRPRSRRRAERCLTMAEREEISGGIARGASGCAIARTLGRSHTTVCREINVAAVMGLSRARGRAGRRESGATPACDEARALWRSASAAVAGRVLQFALRQRRQWL
jgi:Helix-turn-helix domain